MDGFCGEAEAVIQSYSSMLAVGPFIYNIVFVHVSDLNNISINLNMPDIVSTYGLRSSTGK